MRLYHTISRRPQDGIASISMGKDGIPSQTHFILTLLFDKLKPATYFNFHNYIRVFNF